MIRLSTAHAKARLSSKVQEQDARAAEEVLQFALFKEVLKRQKRKKRKLNNGVATAENENGENESDEEEEEVDEMETDVPLKETAVAEKLNGSDAPASILASMDVDTTMDPMIKPDR